MARMKAAEEYRDRISSETYPEFQKTDPEFMERFEHFAFGEVVQQADLDDRTRFMAILAALLGCQGKDEFQVILPAALNAGVLPVEVKEIVYQATAYLGMGREFPIVKDTTPNMTNPRLYRTAKDIKA